MRKLDARLLALGAKRIFERGEGDEDATYASLSSSKPVISPSIELTRDVACFLHRLEADYEQWRKNLWQPLCAEFGIPCVAEASHIKYASVPSVVFVYSVASHIC